MSYQHLSAEERMCIFYRHQNRQSIRSIARYLNRSHSTISRELKRNDRPLDDSCYWHEYAQVKADERKAKPRHAHKFNHQKLRHYVLTHLELGWSPEIIAHRIKREFPRNSAMRISSETIYLWVYKNALAGGDWYTYLVRCHKKRRRQRRYGSLRGSIRDRVDISHRPDIVDLRKRFGDWEGDTMVGRQHQGRLVTHVERKSRYLLAGKANDGTAQSFNLTSHSLFNKIPKQFRKTLTLDNGSENANFKSIEEQLNFKVFFAKPYASWERGTNENTNGLIRRYFPKGTNFLDVSHKQLAKVVTLLNNRPRKCLNYRTPFEVFNSVTRGAL